MYGSRLIPLPLVAAEFLDLAAFHHLRRNYSNHQLGWREAEVILRQRPVTFFLETKISYQMSDLDIYGEKNET